MSLSPPLRRLLRACLLPVLAATALPLHSATFTVNSNLDNGAPTNCAGGGTCTLRAALVAANATPGQDTIRFALPTGSVIPPMSAFPTITAPVVIDARPSPTHSGRPTVFLDGLVAGASADGLRFGNGAAGSSVYGLGIARFGGSGIELTGNAHAVTIRGCEFGYTNLGALAGNSIGIFVGTDSNSIGQTYIAGTGFVGAGNTIVASSGDAITITGHNNLVYGNRIGHNTPASGNNVGIRVLTGNNNIIGGFAGGDSSGNRILSSASHGVIINGNGNAIRANRIGVTEGNTLYPNSGSGIVVSGTGNIIGGASLDARNVIEGNDVGILVGDPGTAQDTQVLNNLVARNRGTGIRVRAGSSSLIDGASIHGNGTAGVGDGIRLDSVGNTVRRNLIGSIDGNNGEGIFLSSGASGNTIGPDNVIDNNRSGIKVEGGSNSIDSNIIGRVGAGNSFEGVWLLFAAGNEVIDNDINSNGSHGIRIDSDDNLVESNRIGRDAGNGNAGVYLTPAASGNLVLANVIGNNLDGVLVQGAGNHIDDNFIGVLPNRGDIGNARFGVHVEAGGTGSRVQGNGIEGNASAGVQVQAGNVTLCGNRIGGVLDSEAISGRGNGHHGVAVRASNVNVGDGCAESNLIVFNEGEGISVTGASNTRIASNRISANAAGGVALFGESNQSWIEFNRIEDNALEAVYIATTSNSERNRIRGNQMRGNALGIDLGGDGPTANDPGDADEGPNRLQNTPVLLFNAAVGETGLQVGYSVDTALANATWPLTIEVFAGDGNAPGEPSHEGASLLGTGTCTTPGVADVTVARPPAGTRWLVATLTDADGNTSEFSAALEWVGAGASDVIFSDGFENE